MNRDIFVTAYDGEVWVAVNVAVGRGDSVDRAIELVVVGHNAQVQEGIEEGSSELDVSPEGYEAFSWNTMPLGGDLRVAQIPRPGVLIAVQEEAVSRTGEDAAIVAILLRQELEKGDSNASKRFQRFVEGPAARWRPLPITTVDLFVSFHPADRPVVDDLTGRLDKEGLTYIASSRPGHDQGAEDARSGIAAAALVLSVVSASSLDDPWVACEMGAAWALDRPILPARLNVEADELPSLMASYQSLPIGSEAAHEKLVGAVHAFLTSRLEE